MLRMSNHLLRHSDFFYLWCYPHPVKAPQHILFHQMAENSNPTPSAFSQPDNSGKVRNFASTSLAGGKLPPQALDMEEAVLGALLLEKDALHRIMDVLKAHMFYKDANQKLFEIIIELFGNSEPIDILTVKNALRKAGKLEQIGGAFYLTELTSRVASAANIEYHARIVAEKFILRQLIQVSDKVIHDAYDETSDVFELLDHTEQQLFEISESNLRRNYLGMPELVMKTLERLEEMRSKDSNVTGIPSGFMDLDSKTAGWQKTDLVIIAARPAMGKTALTLTLARNASLRFNTPVAFFSLEMAAIQLTQRLICAEAELDAQKVRTGRLEDYEWKQLITRIGGLSKTQLFIDDTPALSIWDLRAKCRRLKAEKGIGMVIIDYLQLMSGNATKGGNREQEIAGISRALKEIAKELDVCVIALSQLSRAVESRGGDKRPVLSDLRESGCLAGDTLILDAETGKRVPIRELAERAVQAPVQALGVDTAYQVGSREMTRVFYSGKKQIFELVLRSGKKIKASANHPFLKLSGWTRLDELASGDRIAVPRKITISQPENPLSQAELTLLAHLMGDGCILPRQPYHYTSQDEANLAVVAETAKDLFGIEARQVAQKNWYHVYLPSPYHLTHGKQHPITIWYDRLGLDRVRSYEKRAPEAIFSCDEAHIAHFLHHLWATDGNISWKILNDRKRSAAIYFGTTSEVLATQVQHLLLRLGIHSRISIRRKGNYRPSHIVTIQGKENQLRFLQEVGCFGKRGEIIPELIEALKAIETNPNYDVIPKEAWQTVVAHAKQEAGLTWREFQSGLGTQYSGSALFKRGISRDRMTRIATLMPDEAIERLAHSEVLWEEIESITALGIEDVYDATVPVVHNFVANDIIVHNSIEQDADMVMFLYRPEYYGFETDDEGNSTLGMAELIIAKQRNGPTGTVKLQFIGKYGKFGEWSFGSNPDMEGAYASFGGAKSGTITLQSKMNGDFDPDGPRIRPSDDDMNVPF